MNSHPFLFSHRLNSFTVISTQYTNLLTNINKNVYTEELEATRRRFKSFAK